MPVIITASFDVIVISPLTLVIIFDSPIIVLSPLRVVITVPFLLEKDEVSLDIMLFILLSIVKILLDISTDILDLGSGNSFSNNILFTFLY